MRDQMAISTFFNKPLSEVTPDEVNGLLDGTLTSRNPLYSEDLSSAWSKVTRLDNPDLTDALRDAARLLLTGENSKPEKGGFGWRQNIGIGVNAMLNDGDTGPLDRVIAHSAYEPEVKAAAKLLKAELRAHIAENGIASPSKPQPALRPS
jgi:hypothetical protein